MVRKSFIISEHRLRWELERLDLLNRSIHLFFRDHSPHTAAGVGDVPGIAGDEVDVEVGHCLPGGRTDIDADIPAVRMISFLQNLPAAAEEVEEGDTLRLRRLEEGGDMPERDDEGVARVHREGVGPCIGEGVLHEGLSGGGIAEGAGGACPRFVAHTWDFHAARDEGNGPVPAEEIRKNYPERREGEIMATVDWQYYEDCTPDVNAVLDDYYRRDFSEHVPGKLWDQIREEIEVYFADRMDEALYDPGEDEEGDKDGAYFDPDALDPEEMTEDVAGIITDALEGTWEMPRAVKDQITRDLRKKIGACLAPLEEAS
jgi:hypothetical protein